MRKLDLPSNPIQDKFLLSPARFKIFRAARRVGKSFTAAKDVISDVLMPGTRGWIIGPCVDDKTEILSKRGWLTYKEIKINDVVLTLNKNGMGEGQKCEKVIIQPSEGSLISIEQRGHSSATTINDKWLVGYITSNPRKRTLGHRFTTTEEMTKPNEFILTASNVVNLPTEKVYEDAFV